MSVSPSGAVRDRAGRFEQIDFIFADYGWQVLTSRAWPDETSDHRPVTAELLWGR